MIDRTQLTEALAELDHELPDWEWAAKAMAPAAQWALDFPTDEQVEAAAKVHAVDTRAVLEAVRDTMIGDTE